MKVLIHDKKTRKLFRFYKGELTTCGGNGKGSFFVTGETHDNLVTIDLTGPEIVHIILTHYQQASKDKTLRASPTVEPRHTFLRRSLRWFSTLWNTPT